MGRLMDVLLVPEILADRPDVGACIARVEADLPDLAK